MAERPFWAALTSTCHSRSRSIFHCSSLKSSDDVTHTHHFMSVSANPLFPRCHQTWFLGFLGVPHPIPTPLPAGLNLDRLLALLPFAASSIGLWVWSGYETQMDVNLCSLILFWSDPPSPWSTSQIPKTLHYQVELFGPGLRWTSGLGAFLGRSFWVWQYHWWAGSRQKDKKLHLCYSSHQNVCHCAEG